MCHKVRHFELINYLSIFFSGQLELVIFVIPVIVPMSSSVRRADVL